ncbi:MAG: trypsin-like peptidase domain-containing protein [Candidatus Hydrogenedentes bacterium]|nr:trypsin-like peptidase domain-containing protein [Candidatus Hydrogenedentota bacterium]
MVFENQLAPRADGGFTLHTDPFTYGDIPPCSGEPFADQPIAPYCTAFLVAPDIVVTTGNCFYEGNFTDSRFVFGFIMNDDSTAVTEFDASSVYQGIEIIARDVDNGTDFSIVRLDRPVVYPGAVPLPLRTSGAPGVGTRLGVIGHPFSLPLKTAFGEDTVVLDDSAEFFLLANLDTSSGNTGSPVFNAETGQVEGLLAYGQGDVVFEEGCFRSAQLSDEDGAEGILRTTAFVDHLPIPSPLGRITLEKPAIRCSDRLTVYVTDINVPNGVPVLVELHCSNGDMETIQLQEIGSTYGKSIESAPGEVMPGDGTLNVSDGVLITVQYVDADSGEAAPTTVEESVIVDCVPPELLSATLLSVSGSTAALQVSANEPVRLLANLRDETCANELITFVTPSLDESGELLLSGLTASTAYTYSLQLQDAAGNVLLPPTQQCQGFTTLDLNDDCARAEEIELDLPVAGDNSGANTDTTPSCTNDFGDLWYHFVAPETAGYRFDTCNSTTDTTLALYQGACDDLFELDCVDDVCGFQAASCVGLEEGEEVFVRVATYSVESAGTFELVVTRDDTCLVNVPVTSGFSLTPASGAAPLTVSASNTSTGAVFYVWDYGDGYTGTAASPTHVFESPGEYNVCLTAFGAGADGGWSASTTCQTLSVLPGPPGNDQCSQAQWIPLNQAMHGSSAGATTDMQLTGKPVTDGADLWFEFYAPRTGVYRMDAAASTFDTTLAVFSGDCDDASLTAYADTGEIWMSLLADRRVLIRIAGINGATGDYSLRIERAVASFGPAGTQIDGIVSCAAGSSEPHNLVQDALPILATIMILFMAARWRARRIADSAGAGSIPTPDGRLHCTQRKE